MVCLGFGNELRLMTRRANERIEHAIIKIEGLLGSIPLVLSVYIVCFFFFVTKERLQRKQEISFYLSGRIAPDVTGSFIPAINRRWARTASLVTALILCHPT